MEPRDSRINGSCSPHGVDRIHYLKLLRAFLDLLGLLAAWLDLSVGQWAARMPRPVTSGYRLWPAGASVKGQHAQGWELNIGDCTSVCNDHHKHPVMDQTDVGDPPLVSSCRSRGGVKGASRGWPGLRLALWLFTKVYGCIGCGPVGSRNPQPEPGGALREEI
jgi:hypothetical protein